MRLQRFPKLLVLLLPIVGCASPEEKICSEGFALASDGNCYAVAQDTSSPGGGGGDCQLPVESYNSSDGCLGWGGYRGSTRHVADDYCDDPGTDVEAIADGVVAAIARRETVCENWGPIVLIEHTTTDDGSICSIYGHVEAVDSLSVGQTVEIGEHIGDVHDGSGLGCGWSNHIHFGVINGGCPSCTDSGCGAVGYLSETDWPGSYIDPVAYVTDGCSIESGHGPTHDGFFSNVALSGTSLTVSGKVWAAEGIDKLTITVGDETDSSDPRMYSENYGGSTTEVWFGPLTIELGDTDLNTGSYGVGLWVQDMEGVPERVDVGGPIDYTAPNARTSVDLDPATPSVSSRTPTAGSSITVSGDVDNDGTGASGSFTMAAYLSANTSWSSTSDTLLDTWTESSISAGGTGSYSESISIPSSTTADTYYVIVVADPDDNISEDTESDNTACSPSVTVSATSTTVDLDPATPSVSSRTPTAGSSITVSGDVDNDGTGASGSFTMAAYLSANTSWSSTSDTLLDTWTESSISAGGTGSYSESISIPSSTTADTYYVIVVADPNDNISEVTESDNTAYSSTISVTGACSASDYWSPDSTSDTVEGRTADGTSNGTGNGTDLEIEVRDDGTGDVEFRVCKSSSRFSGNDIWVVFDEDESGAGVIFEAAVATSSSSYCTSWQSLGVGYWGEGDLLGGNWHIESPSPSGTTWGPGCIDDGNTSADCWFFDGHDTMERTCL